MQNASYKPNQSVWLWRQVSQFHFLPCRSILSNSLPLPFIWLHLSSVNFLSLLWACQRLSSWRWPFHIVIEMESCLWDADSPEPRKSASEIILQKHTVLGSFAFSFCISMNAWSICLTLSDKCLCVSIFFCLFFANIYPFPSPTPNSTIWEFTKQLRIAPVNFISLLCYLLSPGKGSGGLNLGNFFASRQGYSRKGFDRLSTEGSDLEKEDDGSESEEEYSAPLPAAAPPSWTAGSGPGDPRRAGFLSLRHARVLCV